jgi:hypothetical protein
VKLEIPPRFCGPPDVANGGIVAGLLARGMKGPVEVALRAPVPLATPLDVVEDGDARALVLDGRELARALPAKLELEVPAAPDRREVARRAGTCRALRTHPFPRDFVCGPERAPGDGLRILPGMLDGRLAAALFDVDASLCGTDGIATPELHWAALDSSTSFPLLEPESARALEPLVLGKLCVALEGRLHAGERALVIAWPLAREGRKLRAGGALFAEDGARVAIARAVWVSVAGKPRA